MDVSRGLAWDAGTWLNPPARVRTDADDLVVTARSGSDFWRTTSYGFIHDDGHALLNPFPLMSAVEVTFLAHLEGLYDQAGVLVRIDDRNWIKAGVEMTDGAPHLGAVVTRGESDWSMAPVADWAGRHVTIRVSRFGDALTVRARCDDEPWRMVRLAPLAPSAIALAGPFCCAPTNGGLEVRFTRFVIGPPDTSLHQNPA